MLCNAERGETRRDAPSVHISQARRSVLPSSVDSDPTESSCRDAPAWHAGLTFGLIAVVVWLVASLSIQLLPSNYRAPEAPGHREPRLAAVPLLFPGEPWFEAWVHWDSGWYYEIAQDGYREKPSSEQSPVAFFPAYPLLMRAGAAVVGDTLRAGILLTLASGAALAMLFWAWLRERLNRRAAWTALGLFVLFPWAYYLYGAVYADALFLAAVVAAFVLLERNRPWLSGLAGAVATAARPVGIVVVIGLVVRALERNDVFAAGWRKPSLRAAGRALRSDGGVLLSVAGLGAYSLYLWKTFGNPFFFVEAQKGWTQAAGPRSWFKLEFFDRIGDLTGPLSTITYLAHPVVTLVALALVPLVFKRFGLGYGVYCLLIIGLAAMSTKDFFGMARYSLGAFPVFAVAGQLLADRPRLRMATLLSSSAGLGVATWLFARGSYLS